MKKNNFYIKYLATIFLLLVVFTGCKKDFFDAKPDNLLSIEQIFGNREQTLGWRGGLYGNVINIWDQPYSFFYPQISDEVDVSNWTNDGGHTYIRDYLAGALAPSNYYGGAGWSFMNHDRFYESIRLINIFLENVDKNPLITDNEKIAFKAEARFLRGFYHWWMMKEFGPIVLAPETIGTPTDDYQKARSTWDECVAAVVTDFDAAEKDLPAQYLLDDGTIDNTQVGRINKMIVIAVKSQLLLYSASSLYNGNTEFSDFRNLDGTALITQQYDANKWKLAADACKAAIDITEGQGKKLYEVTTSTDPFRNAFLSVRNLFWDGWKDEGVWMRQSGMFNYEIHCSPRSTGQNGGYNGLAVNQEFVDAFYMQDGKSITESVEYKEDQYASAGNDYYVTGTNSMYQKREPRFYAYVTFNGAKNPGVSKSGFENSRVEFFLTGTSGKKNAPRDFPNTGYTVRKNIHPTFSVAPDITQDRPTMLIRLPELYLNYAEALNESSPGNADILLYLNKIRKRAGLPNISALSQADMREKIRQERRIELCFEGQRFFDVRRWKVADKPGYYQGGQYHGMDMNAGTGLSDPAFHTRKVAIRRAKWNRRNYFFPYKQSEIDRNKLLVQAPGY